MHSILRSTKTGEGETKSSSRMDWDEEGVERYLSHRACRNSIRQVHEIWVSERVSVGTEIRILSALDWLPVTAVALAAAPNARSELHQHEVDQNRYRLATTTITVEMRQKTVETEAPGLVSVSMRHRLSILRLITLLAPEEEVLSGMVVNTVDLLGISVGWAGWDKRVDLLLDTIRECLVDHPHPCRLGLSADLVDLRSLVGCTKVKVKVKVGHLTQDQGGQVWDLADRLRPCILLICKVDHHLGTLDTLADPLLCMVQAPKVSNFMLALPHPTARTARRSHLERHPSNRMDRRQYRHIIPNRQHHQA